MKNIDMAEVPQFWKTMGTRVRRYVNTAAWLEYFSPRFFLVSAVGAVLFYALRRMDAGLIWAGLALGAVVVLLAAWTYVHRKNQYFDQKQAFAFMDSHLELKSSLSAAYEGISSWPESRKGVRYFRWKSPSLFLWVPMGAGLIVAACLLPLPAARAVDTEHWTKPPSILTMEKWIEDLEDMRGVNKEDVDKLSEKLDELLQRPTEELYKHAALEAAASLEEAMKQDLMQMAQNLKQLQKAMAPGLNENNQFDPSKLDAEALKKALDAMKEQNLRLSNDLSESSNGGNNDEKGGDNGENGQKQGEKPGNSPLNLSPDQIMGMSADELGELMQGLGDIASSMEGMGLEGLEDLLGDGEGEGEGEGGGGPGNGAPQRGRGDAPLTFGKEAPEMSLNKEKLETDPNAKAILGDKVGEEIGAHEVNEEEFNTESSGGIKTPGKGGQATWADRYTPDEREALKEFFK